VPVLSNTWRFSCGIPFSTNMPRVAKFVGDTYGRVMNDGPAVLGLETRPVCWNHGRDRMDSSSLIES
jgi:hypothetical protein